MARLQSLPNGLKTAAVYAYVLTTVQGEGSRLWQFGCAPNFQGGLVTLCTCRHMMRTSLPRTASWEGIWIAGLAASDATSTGRNALFYLMQVGEAYESHYDLWHALPEPVRRSKDASLNPLGDVYHPLDGEIVAGDQRFDWRSYQPPVDDHVHSQNDQWHRDVNYIGYGGRHPTLLVGAEDRSFIWSRPLLLSRARHPRTKRHYRTKRWESLDEFLGSLDQSDEAGG